MIALKKFPIETHFSPLNLVSRLCWFCIKRSCFCLFSVYSLFLGLIHRVSFFSFFSVSEEKTLLQTDSPKSLSSAQLESESLKPMVETEELQESDMNGSEDSKSDGQEKAESPKLVFKFSYQTETFEKLSREGYRVDEDGGRGLLGLNWTPPSSTAYKYETLPAKNLSLFVEAPKAVNFSFGNFSTESVKCPVEDEKDFLQDKVEHGGTVSGNDRTESSVLDKNRTEDSVSADYKESENLAKDENWEFSEKIKFLTQNDFLESTDSDSGTMDSSHIFTNQFIESDDAFLSDSDFEDDLDSKSKKDDSVDLGQSEEKTEEGSDSEEDLNELESLWEHQDLIEQLKMELKKVKATGLPTILEEEDECPKFMEGLKPWKIEEKKFMHVDTMGELHKFYKSYRERMRKFDILNYQKMYALGLLQSKDPLQAISAVEPSPPPVISSVFPVNLRLWKPRKPETDPMINFVREIHGDLENVYVGQMCLSWEILQWQYEKALEFWESDVYGIRRYNEVAGEFQQFQVLVQRFLENEPFEGPRVQHYVKKRCVLRNLLQVPVIREDNKDRRKARRRDLDDNEDDDAITSDQLVDIMEESIRLFWRFVRVDKSATSICQKSRSKAQIEPEDPEGLEMLTEIKSTLQKKEKKLKDVLRCEKCIIRRFQKHRQQEDSGEEQVLHFFSQVDMKLVTRVLNMSKVTRDHLVWCHNKLSKINFVNRRIHLDPSFCLFPAC